MQNFGFKRALFGMAAGIGLSWPVSDATADLSNELEPDYAQAVLDYNARKYDNALRMLSDLQRKSPTSTEVLELKAITLRAQKNDAEAARVYRELIRLKTKERKDKREVAPYAFELGVIRYNERNWKQSEQYLNFAAKSGFNAELAQFYLGLVQSETQEWDKAERSFKSVIGGNVEELKPPAHYYLAQVTFKLGQPADGFSQLVQAKNSAQKYMDRKDVQPESKKMAEQVITAANSTLAPYDKSQGFGNFSLLMGYDSNVLLVPSEGSGTDNASGKSTLKTLLSIGAGYATSPLRTWQWVPSIRTNFNKNFNPSSTTGEFADTTASLYATKDALAPFSWGAKTDLTAVFQNQTDTTGAKKYHLYNTTASLGPYVKWDATKKWSIGAEAGYRLVSFTGDDTVTESLRRSGNAILGRITAQKKTGSRKWNPTFVLRTELQRTDGVEYDARIYGVQIINSMKLEKIDFSQVISVDRTDYATSATGRGDTYLSLAFLGSKKIGPRWALVGSGEITTNRSSDSATYSYDRFALNAGIGYAF